MPITNETTHDAYLTVVVVSFMQAVEALVVLAKPPPTENLTLTEHREGCIWVFGQRALQKRKSGKHGGTQQKTQKDGQLPQRQERLHMSQGL